MLIAEDYKTFKDNRTAQVKIKICDTQPSLQLGPLATITNLTSLPEEIPQSHQTKQRVFFLGEKRLKIKKAFFLIIATNITICYNDESFE